MAASISKALARRILRPDGCSTGATALPANWVRAPLTPLSSLFSTSAPSFSSASSTQDEEKRSILSKLLLFIPGAITFGLGTWQIIRRQEKIKMLEYRQNRLAAEPLKCDQIAPSHQNLESLEFRKVQCRGFFDDTRSIYIGPRSRNISGVTENGYYLITPLSPVSDNPESVQLPILVNRGWVPRAWRDKSMEASGDDRQPSPVSPRQEKTKTSWWRFWSKEEKSNQEEVQTVNPVEVIGVIRGSEKPSIFVPANDPSSSQWFYVDVPAIARTCGLPENTIYIEDINENIDPSCPYPVPKDVNTLIRSSVMPQDHLNYTLTWYSLSAAVSFMAFKRLKSKRRR
ncbi:OLC1v1014352C1 [Oldenlandia corymbosa var. corymbosa]|uniref:SURF1-like protein n=1 Tax=Oldenlandia corymbosa var. corymbosa TaxID=529605 RepID=A0AAV1E3Y5_OLDCO|nr:OLC1v1014352C1 [Oldenlandia corymbosa var. corymbosa]